MHHRLHVLLGHLLWQQVRSSRGVSAPEQRVRDQRGLLLGPELLGAAGQHRGLLPAWVYLLVEWSGVLSLESLLLGPVLPDFLRLGV